MPKVKVKMSYSGTHKRGGGKTLYRFTAGVPVEFEVDDLKAIDKKDYEIVKDDESAKKDKK